MLFPQPRIFVLLGFCAIVTMCGAKERYSKSTSNEGVSRSDHTWVRSPNLGSDDAGSAKDRLTTSKQDFGYIYARGHDKGRDTHDHKYGLPRDHGHGLHGYGKYPKHPDHHQHIHEHTHKHIHDHGHEHGDTRTHNHL